VSVRRADRKEFEDITFKSGKGVEDFSLRLSGIVSELHVLREDMTELKALHKYLSHYRNKLLWRRPIPHY
jgi:hypothetical protein